MTSFQSTFGEDEGIADELAENQQSISIAEFFEKNKHMLGFDSPARGLVTAVKEAVDNALDACEEADIRPNVYVEIEEDGDYYRLIVEDNGPGITADSLPKVFGKLLYGSRFHVREQNRGQQGIGISAAVLHAQKTSGKPAKITSRTKGSERARYFELIVDTETNEPEITVDETLEPGESPLGNVHGTRIELEMEANMRARSRLHDYVEQTAVVNPHATLTLDEPGLDEPRRFERGTEQLPDETEEIRPHPHGVELGTLVTMLEATDSYSLSGFLQEEFTRVGKKTAEKLLDAFRDRHFGREMGWAAPDPAMADDDDDGPGTDVEAALVAAVSNKGAEATAAFAERVAATLRERERTTRQGVAAVVDEVADDVEAEFDRQFGATVRDNAVAAAWGVLTGLDPEADEDDAEMDPARLRPTLYAAVDDATTVRKDDAAVAGLAERLARKFAAGHPRSRLTRETLVGYVDAAADATEEYDDATFGETARENVVEALWERMETVEEDPPAVETVADDRDAAADLLAAMRATEILAPPTDCLSPITADLVEAGLGKEYDADFFAAASRDAEVHGGDPFVVEAGIAYGGEIEADGQVEVLRFANRVPLVYQRGACATTDVVKEIGWRNYGLDQSGGRGIPTGPAVIAVHVASTNVPFTSESKDAVANVPEIEDEIELAIREAARELKSYLKRQRSMAKRREKQEVLGEILPAMAEKVAAVTDRERPDVGPAMARIMNNVAVEREVDDGEVTLRVENHSDRTEQPDVTDIVTAEPESPPEEVTTVEMDGEWVLKWNPEVPAGETAELSYAVDDDAEFTVDVDDVESAKLTIDA